jgi:hypothetical protein
LGGTSRTFATSSVLVARGISNAFRDFDYHQMMLSDAAGSDFLAPGWHPTNGFLLHPTLDPIAMVPMKGVLGTRQLPYEAYFHITVNPVASNETRVTVQTVAARVFSGFELKHSGMGFRSFNVQPVRREEESVLAAISKDIDSEQGKRRPENEQTK